MLIQIRKKLESTKRKGWKYGENVMPFCVLDFRRLGHRGFLLKMEMIFYSILLLNFRLLPSLWLDCEWEVQQLSCIIGNIESTDFVSWWNVNNKNKSRSLAMHFQCDQLLVNRILIVRSKCFPLHDITLMQVRERGSNDLKLICV